MKPVDRMARCQAEGPGLQLNRVLQASRLRRLLLGTLPPTTAFLEDYYLNRQELGEGAPSSHP